MATTYGSPPVPTEPGADVAAVAPALEAGGIDVIAPPVTTTPQYQVMGEERILVSKSVGPMWKGRVKAGEKARKKFEDAWKEAVSYYQNDQTSHRTGDGPHRAGNRASRQLNNAFYETENVVFSNTTILLPRLYPKNPRVEVTANTDEGKPFERYVERLLNALAVTKESPGLNLKPKARRAVLTSLLTNISWFMVGYNQREETNAVTQQQLQDLAKEYEEAKDAVTINEIEGKLRAIEEKTDLLSEPGPFVRFFSPTQVVVDPTASEPDFSDAGWIGYWDYVPTDVVRAKYMKKKGGEDGNRAQWESIYKPTHVVCENKAEDGDEFDFSLFKDASDHSAYGYGTKEAFEKNLVTKCWYIWDKATRRVFVFHDADWTWPLWVLDDPYKLPRFFPFVALRFHEDVEGGYSKGEVTYYLDQQDALNEIHDETRRWRQWVRRHIIYNSLKMTQEEAEKLLKGDDNSAVGVKLPEGAKIEDLIGSMKPPSMQFDKVFDSERILASIARQSSVPEVLRGAQFKTNTTNKAIEEYNSRDNIRFGERVDAIEDFIGDTMSMVGHLVLQFMSAEEVARFVTMPPEAPWQNLPADQIRSLFTFQVVGGSSQKPTSETKKEEALRVGQILGQFASASPAAILVALRVFEQAFDEVVIKSEDWALIYQSIAQQMQPEQPAEQPPAEDPGPPGGDVAPDEAKVAHDVRQRINALPPEGKQALEKLVQAGVPPGQALQRVSQGAQT